MAPLVEPVTEPVWLGEGPHWDQDDQALYFVSIFDLTVNKYVPSTGKHTKSKLDAMPTFIIPLEGKRNHFVVGLHRKVVEIEWNGEENGAKVLRTIAEVDHENPNNRFNDAKADPRGRLFAGTMGHEYEPGKFDLKKGKLYRFDEDGTAHKVLDNIDISNGLCWDEKNSAFYYIDSFEYTIRKYDYDLETGELSNLQHVFTMENQGRGPDYKASDGKSSKLPGILDGMTIDADGNLWVANFDGYQILKISPKEQRVVQTIPIPALQVTSATFGGPALDVLYVTSAAMNRGQEQLPPAGATFRLTGTGARGLPNTSVRFR